MYRSYRKNTAYCQFHVEAKPSVFFISKRTADGGETETKSLHEGREEVAAQLQRFSSRYASHTRAGHYIIS